MQQRIDGRKRWLDDNCRVAVVPFQHFPSLFIMHWIVKKSCYRRSYVWRKQFSQNRKTIGIVIERIMNWFAEVWSPSNGLMLTFGRRLAIAARGNSVTLMSRVDVAVTPCWLFDNDDWRAGDLELRRSLADNEFSGWLYLPVIDCKFLLSPEGFASLGSSGISSCKSAPSSVVLFVALFVFI